MDVAKRSLDNGVRLRKICSEMQLLHNNMLVCLVVAGMMLQGMLRTTDLRT